MNILRTNPGNARNMRILGLDYGSKTVGVAVSDPLGLTAQKVETIWRKQTKWITDGYSYCFLIRNLIRESAYS